MKDGTKFGGYFSTKSFASSDPDERDLFVEAVYQIGEDGSQWTAFPDRSIWLNGAEIQSIEFIGDEGDSDEQ